MDKINHSQTDKTKLSEAIDKLKAYADDQLLIKSNSISKTISLMRSIIENGFDHPRQNINNKLFPPNKQEILTAIELINRNRFFIEKLKKGTPADQKLAEEFTKTINAFNENCDKKNQLAASTGKRLSHFFFKTRFKEQTLPKIALPKKITVQHHYPAPQAKPKITLATSSVKLSKQSMELFQMKVIALLEKYGIASNPEARNYVKTSPIHTSLQEDNSVCTLTQTLSLFPGQTIVVMGNSSLNPLTQTIDRILPDSFHLSLELTQTGFPHPMQRAGWSLAGQLIPDSPQRIDLLHITAPLFQKRNEVITGLLEQGPLLKRAKELLGIKRKVSEINSSELLELHKNLILAILKETPSEKVDHLVEPFFHDLASEPNPIHALSETYYLIKENFIVKPYQLLLNAIIKGKINHPEMRYSAAKIYLEKAIQQTNQEAYHSCSTTTINFTNAVGKVYAKASANIILQHLSEDLIFDPPTLSPFECKFQATAYAHLNDFINELLYENEYTEAKVYSQMKQQIVSDRILFEEKASHTDISKELSDYFQMRFESLQKSMRAL